MLHANQLPLSSCPSVTPMSPGEIWKEADTATHTKDCTVTKALSQGFDPCHQISAPTSLVAFTLNVCVNGLWPAG